MKLRDVVEECSKHPRSCCDCPLYVPYTLNKGGCYKACAKYMVLIPDAISYLDIENDKEEY